MLSDACNRWVAAAIGSQQVSAIESRTGASLLAIGGFSCRDDSPTLAQFEQYAAAGDVHYFLTSGRPRSQAAGRTAASDADGAHTASVHRDSTLTRPDSPSAASNTSTSGGRITAWVQAHYTPIAVDRMRVYELTVPPRG